MEDCVDIILLHIWYNIITGNFLLWLQCLIINYVNYKSNQVKLSHEIMRCHDYFLKIVLGWGGFLEIDAVQQTFGLRPKNFYRIFKIQDNNTKISQYSTIYKIIAYFSILII